MEQRKRGGTRSHREGIGVLVLESFRGAVFTKFNFESIRRGEAMEKGEKNAKKNKNKSPNNQITPRVRIPVEVNQTQKKKRKEQAGIGGG